MSETQAIWSVSLDCDCPACKDYVDLTDADGFWADNSTLDIPEHGTKRSTDMPVLCPTCGHEFEVDCEW